MEHLTLRKVPYENERFSDGEVPSEWKEIVVEAFNQSLYHDVLESEDVKNNIGKSFPTNQKVICDRYSCYYEDKCFKLGLDYFDFEKRHLPGRNGRFYIHFGKECRDKHLPVYNVIESKYLELFARDI